MTTAGEGGALTALDLLFGPDADPAETLAGEILSPGGGPDLGRALAHLPEPARTAAAQEAAATAVALLTADLIGVLVRGWREHRDIVSAARQTLAVPARTELVSVAAHEVVLDQRPSVSILVDGQLAATLQLGLCIVFDVNALLLLVSDGRLSAVRSGRCDITATLAVQGEDLIVGQAHLELPGVIRPRRGIRLLPADEDPVGEDPAGEDPAGEHSAGEHSAGEYPPGEYAGSGLWESEHPATREAPWMPAYLN
jgi:hypothetical protein